MSVSSAGVLFMAARQMPQTNQLSNTKPLAGRTVAITRARTQANDFVTELEQFGARVISCPTIEVVEPESFERLDEAITHLYGYDWLIFTSVNGVEYFLRRFEAGGHDVSEIDELRVCAVGDATAERLREAQLHVDVVPHNFKAEGVFEALSQFVGGYAALSGLNFLLPRAAVARDFLPRTLEEAGSRVDVVPAYQTVVPDELDRGRISAMLAAGTDCIAFTSASSVRNLARLFDTQDLSAILQGVTVACIGDVTSQTAIEHGLHPDIQPEQFTIPELARAIAEYFGRQ
jgi:uroporphyrinogen III methyltransferase / synthase